MISKRLNIKLTKRSPWVLFESGRLFVMGCSIIENPSVFYELAMKWVSRMAESVRSGLLR
jgi:hypothetical protein